MAMEATHTNKSDVGPIVTLNQFSASLVILRKIIDIVPTNTVFLFSGKIYLNLSYLSLHWDSSCSLISLYIILSLTDYLSPLLMIHKCLFCALARNLMNLVVWEEKNWPPSVAIALRSSKDPRNSSISNNRSIGSMEQFFSCISSCR